MSIRFNCKHCSNKLEADEDVAGMVVECPHCSADLVVPKKRGSAEQDDEDDVLFDEDIDAYLEAEEESEEVLPEVDPQETTAKTAEPEADDAPEDDQAEDVTEKASETESEENTDETVLEEPEDDEPEQVKDEEGDQDDHEADDSKDAPAAESAPKVAVAQAIDEDDIPSAEPLASTATKISPDLAKKPRRMGQVAAGLEALDYEDDEDEDDEDVHPTAEAEPGGESVCPTNYRAGMKIGNFEIGYLLGAGSMGQVFLAKQISMDRQVALKILPPEIMSRDDEAAHQFMNEVKMLAKLEHPNIVTAFEAGEDQGIYYLAMQYVNGESLENRLQRERMIPEEEAISVMIKVAQALKHAWERFKLLHQDVKPANIMIDHHGEVKLMDMGIARASTDDEGTAKFVMGTPYYMSPEQASGRLDLDWRTDQYSMGSTLYHLLTGRYPFLGDDPAEVMKKHFADPLTPPKSINSELCDAVDKLIRRMMAKAPDRRYQSWEELISAMRDAMKAAANKGSQTQRRRKRPKGTKARRPAPKRARAGSVRPRYVRSGTSIGASISVFIGIIIAFYLIISIVNVSGFLQDRYNITFPQGMFLPPFRYDAKTDDSREQTRQHTPVRRSTYRPRS